MIVLVSKLSNKGYRRCHKEVTLVHPN